jgi:hypothetical protein
MPKLAVYFSAPDADIDGGTERLIAPRPLGCIDNDGGAVMEKLAGEFPAPVKPTVGLIIREIPVGDLEAAVNPIDGDALRTNFSKISAHQPAIELLMGIRKGPLFQRAFY